MQINQNVEERVIARINKAIGNDFKNLNKASTVMEHYKERLKEISAKLNYESPDNNTCFRSTFHYQQQADESFDFEIEKLTQFSDKLKAIIEVQKDSFNSVEKDLKQTRKLQCMTQYLRIIQDIQEISAALKQAINGRDEAKMVNLYLTLYEDNDFEHSVVGRLKNIAAQSLKSYALNVAAYWHELLIQRFSNEFEATLKSLRWAQKEQLIQNISTTRDIAKAQLLAEYLFLVKSPTTVADQLIIITPNIICQPLTQLTNLLLAPYRQRFMYHFTGTRQTNRLDKPEWFYTQILNWGKETHLFVGKTFQTAAVRAGKLDFNIRLDFLRGLVQLAIEKLVADIELISADECLFAHLIDETLSFEAELRETFGYPSSFPSAILVITQPVYLLKWIALEERFCAEKMDDILQAENPWEIINPNISDDELKIPKCADQFLRLLDAIKDRYFSLIQPGHQLQFLSLQLELIDSFRRRLVQLHSSDSVKSIPILNAINYITMVLREWGENIHYLHLHGALVGPNAPEINSVFEHAVSELDHWSQQLLNNLAIKAVNEIKAKSMSYRHDSWATTIERNKEEPFILSPSAGEMFQTLVTLLHDFECNLSQNLFNRLLRLISQQIDDFILDSMIMNTKFSAAGAAQFNYDMTRNLFALFGQYNRRAELLFKKIHDANKLLNAPCGIALLLLETLKGAKSLEEQFKTLKELDVMYLTPTVCIEVLERRTDIKMI